MRDDPPFPGGVEGDAPSQYQRRQRHARREHRIASSALLQPMELPYAEAHTARRQQYRDRRGD